MAMITEDDYIIAPSPRSVRIAPGQAPYGVERKYPFPGVYAARQDQWNIRIVRPMQTPMRRFNFDLVGNTIGAYWNTPYPGYSVANWLPNYPLRQPQVYQLGYTAPHFVSSFEEQVTEQRMRLMPYLAQKVKSILGGG